MNKLAPKAKIRVYRDPVTGTGYEDTAKLVEFVRAIGDGFEVWKVRFLEGGKIRRTVHPRNIVTGNQRVLRMERP